MHGSDRNHFLERFLVGDICSAQKGHCKLSLILNEDAGIQDDVVFSNHGDYLNVVLNAGNKAEDLAKALDLHRAEFQGKDVRLESVEGESLISIQGPRAKDVVSYLVGQSLDRLVFMTCEKFFVERFASEVVVSRCGYTGEDGFELSIKNDVIEAVCEDLFDAFPEVLVPAGLGARDLLRLEAGMNLHGHDIDAQTNPVEALLMWTVRKKNQFASFVGQERLRQIRKVRAP